MFVYWHVWKFDLTESGIKQQAKRIRSFHACRVQVVLHCIYTQLLPLPTYIVNIMLNKPVYSHFLLHYNLYRNCPKVLITKTKNISSENKTKIRITLWHACQISRRNYLILVTFDIKQTANTIIGMSVSQWLFWNCPMSKKILGPGLHHHVCFSLQRVLNLMGNPVVRNIKNYRKTLISRIVSLPFF